MEDQTTSPGIDDAHDRGFSFDYFCRLFTPSFVDLLAGLKLEAIVPLEVEGILSEHYQTFRAQTDDDSFLIEVSLADEPADIKEILEGEADTSHCDRARRRWLYALLHFTYELRRSIEDPLEAVELLYSDFGYPDWIEGFVRYMPSSSSGEGSIEGVYKEWSDFLDNEFEALRYHDSQPGIRPEG